MSERLNLNLNLGAGSESPLESAVDAEARPDVENVIILGSGPAGWAAAIYTARANLRPLVISGHEIGGQIATTTEVENYPGFPDGITGPELSERMQAQAEKFGATVKIDFVTAVDVNGPPFTVETVNGNRYRANALIIATGASPRKLKIPGEDRLIGRGVSYCATCDGFFFRNKRLLVVGGGDSSLQEALFLTKFASTVTIVHRRDQLRAGPALQRRADANPKIEYIWNTIVTDVTGENKVEAVTLKNVQTGEERQFPTDGVFVYIGHLPNNQPFAGKLALDEHGYLITDKLMRTSVPGIFAAGEIQDSRFRQVATSAGQGVAAAMEAEKYLAEREDHGYPEGQEPALDRATA